MRASIFVLGTMLCVFGVGVFACNSDTEVNVDAGDAATDAIEDAPLDAGSPHCFVDDGGSNDPAASPAFGSFNGAGATGDVCLGGTFAVVQQLAETELVIETGDFGDPNTFFQFQSPIGAVSGSLAFTVGLPAATIGNYSSDGNCGTLGFCAVFPLPDAPEQCFFASGISDCSQTPTTPQGSWQVVIDTLTPFPDDASAEAELVAHGVFRAELVGDGDAGPTTITIGF